MNLKNLSKSMQVNSSEADILKNTFLSILTSLIVSALLYYTLFQSLESFIPKYSFSLFMSILSYSAIIPSLNFMKMYKEFPCMSGMMIGMTFGMIAGFLPGFFIASTSGMFWGSVFGMSFGIFFGIYTGRSCGIMGIMEGLMAGFMGGLMGAMTAVMMINDNLKIAGIIVFLISLSIIVCLNHMISIESKHLERKDKKTGSIIILSAILTIITALFMVFGPRSLLFQ